MRAADQDAALTLRRIWPRYGDDAADDAADEGRLVLRPVLVRPGQVEAGAVY